MKTISERLAVIRATLFLLYQCNARAFTTSAIASLPEPLFFPTILFLLQKLFERLTGPRGLHLATASYDGTDRRSIGAGQVTFDVLADN